MHNSAKQKSSNNLFPVTPLLTQLATQIYANSDDAELLTANLHPDYDLDIELSKLDQLASVAKRALEYDRTVQIIVITDERL